MERKNKIEHGFETYKANLSELIKIRSVLSDDALPFGEGINQALDKVLEISESLGFNTFKDPEGYYGYAEIGSGDLFAVLCHIDVVDEGNLEDWDSDPYLLSERNGKLYGRGTSDDKGPTLAAMFGLRWLLDEGFTLSKKVRFIFGTDEENLWRCLDAYKAKEALPVMGFAPDADFPLVNVEKGMVQLMLRGDSSNIEGGDSYNAVASHATVQLVKPLGDTLGYRYKLEDDILTVYGKSAHASTPEEGENAIYYLSKILKEMGVSKDVENFVVDLYEGDVMSQFVDSVSGPLTFNVGKAIDGGVSLDIRYPVSYTEKDILKGVHSISDPHHLSVERISGLHHLYIPEDSPLVLALMESYKAVTHDLDAKPLKMGGATYARAMDNIVAFGPQFPDDVMSAHQANEFIDIENTKKAIEVYMHAFEKLV